VISLKKENTVLVLCRKESEKIHIPELNVTITLVSVDGNKARIGIEAPKNCNIIREELLVDNKPWVKKAR
jgi:carbon storage regulator CsrA